ncbi:LacI family DNA-binding transcriptional regulator [Corynebacterium sp. A21]|uniref:LacI family DNA-binding transcriptional regulator n=1 Tax=Corynebacterium sp. A21 TaxID=3457318 RepID=UPI003FD4F33B
MVKRPQHRGTLASVAAELGVSRTTVSNAYNRPEQLSAALRTRILAAAGKMGYPGPDPTARSLRTRRVGALGVLLTEHLSYAFEDLASVDFLAGMAEASYGSDTALTLVPAGPGNGSDEDEARAVRQVNQTAVDGFVVYSVAEGDPHLAAVRARHLPVVICDQPSNIADLPFVGIDDFAAIQPAAQALLDAGHRRIGILSIRMHRVRADGLISHDNIRDASLHVQRSRVLGALEVFRQVGIETDSIPVVTRHINDRANSIEAARELLESNPNLSAVLCTTDSMAFGVLDYAREHGISVPEQLSVTGFDGVGPAIDYGLSTVVQPNKAKGAAAGRLLLELVDAHVQDRLPANPAPREILSTHFHAGETIAPPRG